MMRWLEHKIPPPVVALLIAVGMWAVAGAIASVDIPSVVRYTTAGLLALAGGAFDVAGLLAFRQARTTINPLKPDEASALVVSGVYRITRNPMYVGMAFLLAAWAIYLASFWLLAGPLLFVLYITYWQILPEERVLSAKFGAAFDAYRAATRRWL